MRPAETLGESDCPTPSRADREQPDRSGWPHAGRPAVPGRTAGLQCERQRHPRLTGFSNANETRQRQRGLVSGKSRLGTGFGQVTERNRGHGAFTTETAELTETCKVFLC